MSGWGRPRALGKVASAGAPQPRGPFLGCSCPWSWTLGHGPLLFNGGRAVPPHTWGPWAGGHL